ncbi:hypothetical protein EV363DRAFT_1461534 [Boletus edulis]|nr:hypothetical protein EV363DRAFT_1461534 [Boletus edulis]
MFLNSSRSIVPHPSSTVAELLADSFYGCSTLPLRLLSSVGVRGAPHVREFDSVLAKFLKSVPMLSEHVTQYGAGSIAALPAKHKISAITPSDILQDLRGHTLDTEELVTFLRWWMTPARDKLTSDLVDLLDAATLRGNTGKEICLSSVTSFIDPKVLGLHIPSDGPLPLSLIPIGVSKRFDFKELISLRLKEFIAGLDPDSQDRHRARMLLRVDDVVQATRKENEQQGPLPEEMAE